MTMREDNGTGWERHVRVARAMMRRSGRLGPAGDAYVTSQEESKQTQRIETGIGRAPLLNAQTPANTSADPSLGGYCVLYWSLPSPLRKRRPSVGEPPSRVSTLIATTLSPLCLRRRPSVGEPPSRLLTRPIRRLSSLPHEIRLNELRGKSNTGVFCLCTRADAVAELSKVPPLNSYSAVHISRHR